MEFYYPLPPVRWIPPVELVALRRCDQYSLGASTVLKDQIPKAASPVILLPSVAYCFMPGAQVAAPGTVGTRHRGRQAKHLPRVKPHVHAFRMPVPHLVIRGKRFQIE